MGADIASDDLLSQLAQLAADLGPALRPHDDAAMLAALTETARLAFGAAAC